LEVSVDGLSIHLRTVLKGLPRGSSSAKEDQRESLPVITVIVQHLGGLNFRNGRDHR